MIELAPINPRTLILDLVVTNQPPVYSIRQLLTAGAALDMGPSAIRTALSRLTREGQVEHVDRGLYGIGPRGRPLQQRLLAWQQHATIPANWNGDWLLAFCGTADRSNRTVWRRTLRALRLRGFAEAETNVWVRPDNITDSLEDLRQTLCATGGSTGLLLLRASGLDADREAAYRGLWDVPRMLADYQEMDEMLRHSMAGLKSKSISEAAAESLMKGRTCIRMLNFDPALPEALCPSGPRRSMTRTMIAYNKIGTQLWFELLEIE